MTEGHQCRQFQIIGYQKRSARVRHTREKYSPWQITSRILMTPQPRSSRGVSGDGPEGGARRGVLRLRLVTAGLGRHGHRPPGNTTRAARSSLHALRRQCRSRKRGAGAQKSPRWSAERRASCVIGREAPRKRLACDVIACRTDAQRRIRAPVGAPPTPRGGCKFHDPGANAPREQIVLFARAV
jgi:hypothetical protein